MRKLLVIQVAAMGYELLRDHGALRWHGMEFAPTQTVLPAVTCSVQASFRTALPPSEHGMVANGLYHRDLHRPMFWEQSADLVSGERIWQGFRKRGGRVGLMFWQQSLGERADLVLSPAPIHKHHGGMIQDCYSQPAGLYPALCDAVGSQFKLMEYWGPAASVKVGDWIARATAMLLADEKTAPELLLVYLPSLDYDLQRFGPAHARSKAALTRTLTQLDTICRTGKLRGYEVLVYGDYAIVPCHQAAFPNRALLQEGLMSVRDIAGMLYPDFHASPAFAVADHEVAQVYVRRPEYVDRVRRVLAALPGVQAVWDKAEQTRAGVAHANSGELMMLAADDYWLAYPWWTAKRQAPDYATHIDIHNKPGYDPCELFMGWPPLSVSQNTGRIRGTHGRLGARRDVPWACTCDLGRPIDTILDLAAGVRHMLDSNT